MNDNDVNLDRDRLVQVIREAGSPVHINVLTHAVLQAWLEDSTRERRYAPGAQYRTGDTILFQGQRTTVAAVREAANPAQGSFAILTLALPDGTQRIMAAQIPGAPAEDHPPIGEAQVEEALRARATEAREAIQPALGTDPRFVSCQTLQGDLWCLVEMLPAVQESDVQAALAALPGHLADEEPASCTAEELVGAVWGLADDGGDTFALHAFALARALRGCASVVCLGDCWASARAWEGFTERPALQAPRMPTQVSLPLGVEEASPAQVQSERRGDVASEGDGADAATAAERDLEAWRQDRPMHAVFTLRACHYYEGWLPLSGQVRLLFPPLASGRQEIVFFHHFADEPSPFRAWIDRERGRVWISLQMYETLRAHRIYPGARLRIAARTEREYDLATRETDRTEPVRVWRMWLDEDGQIQYEEDREPRRYDVDDAVYVADVRFEDREALFRQAGEIGASIFGLMYAQAVEWWEAGGRKDLVTTADRLFEAVHFDEQGRMTSRATVAWELWRRLAFEPLGECRYRFRPEFGEQVRFRGPAGHCQKADEGRKTEDEKRAEDTLPAQVSSGEPSDEGAVLSIERTRSGQLVATDLVPPGPLFEDRPQPLGRLEPSSTAGQLSAHKDALGLKTAIQPSKGYSPECWFLVAHLVGQELCTLDRQNPFRVMKVGDDALQIEIGTSGKARTIQRQEIETAWEHLARDRKINLAQIRQYAAFNPTYIAAMLAALPGVTHQIKPIRLEYRLSPDEGPVLLPVEPSGSDLSPGEQKEFIVGYLRERGLPIRKYRTIYSLQDEIALVFYNSRRLGNQYWFGPSPSVLGRVRQYRTFFLLLILGSTDKVLVLPDRIVDECLAAIEPSSGHYNIHIRHRSSAYLLKELNGLDVTRYLNAYDLILKAIEIPTRSGSAREEKPDGKTCQSDVEPELKQLQGIVSTTEPVKFEIEIEAEFRQIQEIVKASLVGKTIYTPGGAPNRIIEADEHDLTVATHAGVSKVRWKWIGEVYRASRHLGAMYRKDIQEGRFYTRGQFRSAFIFGLLSQFAHVEVRTKPRICVVCHKPQGSVRLRDEACGPAFPAGEHRGLEPLEEPKLSEPPPPARPRVPGSPPTKRDDMQTKTLFSIHYLEHRLSDHAEWSGDPRAAFEAVRALWQRALEHGDAWNEAQTEDEFVRPILEALGWTFIVQPKSVRRGRITRPDYALFADEASKAEAYPFQGDDDPFYSRALAIAEAKYWGRPLSQKDQSGRDTWKAGANPSHQMVSYLVGTRVAWGILTNGQVWRLYSREVSSTASEFYEVDLAPLLDSLARDGEPSLTQLDQFRRWWLFFRREAFLPDAQAKSFVQRVHEGSATYAHEISDKLKELVFEQVMPEIAGGFVAYRYREMGVREETEESLRQIYQASLSLLYKLLFLLYAEARGLLPIANPGYREQSLTALAQWAAGRLDQARPLSEATHATSRYDALLALFHRVDQGDPGLGIPRYNGGLFNPASPDNRFLEGHRLSDRAVARAVDILVRDAGQPVDYAYISVRNLGSIYEGLLENRLRVVDAAAGRVELVNDKGERKASGSYYTPDYIVEYIVAHTLDPILAEREAEFCAAMDRCAGLRRQLAREDRTANVRRLRDRLAEAERDAREALLGIKVCDPAMGSGHFLVNAVDHLTDGIIQRMQTYHDAHPNVPWEWNPIQRLIERVRTEILEEMERQGIAVDPARLDDTALLTRLVMKRCIYGVDLNKMAVELAKLSLWLHSFTVGAPLSFLDHHLRWGNSLIGTEVRNVERNLRTVEQTTKVSKEARRLAEARGETAREIATAFQGGLFAGPFAGLLDLTKMMLDVVERSDATLADVRQSAEDFDLFQKQLTPYKQVLDLWVSQHFGNRDAYEFLTLYGADVLPAVKGEMEVAEQYGRAIERARDLWRGKRFFHWDLEFPEVFVDLRRRDWAEDPGFDAVVGNPPYLFIISVSQEDRQYYFEAFSTCDYRFDIYGLFVERGLDTLMNGGRFGYIIPHSILNNNSFARLRSKVIDRASQIRIVDFKDRVFAEATNEPMLLLATVRRQADIASPLLQSALLSSAELSKAEDDVFRQYPASLVARLPGRPFIVRGGKWLERLLDNPSTQMLGQFINATQGLRTGDNPRFLTTKPSGNLYRKVLAGADLARYGFDWPGTYVLYNREELDAPRDRIFWEASEKILVQEIRNVQLPLRIVAALDVDRFVGLNTTNAIILKPGAKISIRYILSVISSRLTNQFFRSCFVDNHIATQYLAAIPVRRIAFTTSSAKRAWLAEVGTADAAEFIADHADTVASASSASLSDLSDSALGRWLDERLAPTHIPDLALIRQHNDDPLNAGWQLDERGPVEQSDAVHDLLAHLAERMTAMNEEKQTEVKGFLSWLEREMGASIDDLTRKTYLRNYLGDYQKGEPHLALEDLLDILRRNRRRLRVDPAGRAFQERLAREHEASLDKLLPLKARLAATDRLIDLVVYRLYGLREEEVAVVEGDR